MSDPLATIRQVHVKRGGLVAWYLLISPRTWEAHMVLGRPGWVLTVVSPNGGTVSVPARTRLGAWWKLLRNDLGMSYVL